MQYFRRRGAALFFIPKQFASRPGSHLLHGQCGPQLRLDAARCPDERLPPSRDPAPLAPWRGIPIPSGELCCLPSPPAGCFASPTTSTRNARIPLPSARHRRLLPSLVQDPITEKERRVLQFGWFPPLSEPPLPPTFGRRAMKTTTALVHIWVDDDTHGERRTTSTSLPCSSPGEPMRCGVHVRAIPSLQFCFVLYTCSAVCFWECSSAGFVVGWVYTCLYVCSVCIFAGCSMDNGAVQFFKPPRCSLAALYVH